jgi:hypothetical protein
MALEVALMDENLAEGESVTLEAEYGDVTVKKGEFVPLFQFNPFIFMGLGAFAPPPSGMAPLQKTALPKESLFQINFVDEDFDGVPDDWDEWQSNYPECTATYGELYPWDDLDGDGFSNLDEYIWGGDPCDPAGPDSDFDWLPDQWEISLSCGGGDIQLVHPWEDLDGDGYSNEMEYWMGTDPCDPNDPGGETPVFSDQPAIGLSSGGEGVPPVWTPYEFNLAPFAGHKIALRFKFGFVNQNTNLFRGCAIDDIRIQDEASYLPFEILTPEFGYFGDYYFEEIQQGEVWTGSYLLSFTEGSQQNVFEDPTGTPADYNPAPQTITVSQQGDWVQTEITFAGATCTLEGNFWNQAYDYLNFWFYDKDTDGMNVSGWGEIFLDPETEELSGFIDGQDYNSGMRYWGDIGLTPQQ